MMGDAEVERARVVIILGPTGVGKSKLAIELAEEIGGEIINADSMQVYKYMDIGTAKPTIDEQRRVPHHMIDIVTPDQPFNAALYRTYARKRIDELHQNNKLIFVVGGCGLYIRALTQGLFNHPKVDVHIRENLKREAKEKGELSLYRRLQKVDPETASHIHPNDIFRIIRALEVFDSTGIPISFFRKQHRFGEKPYRTLKIGLEIDREALYDNIEKRVDQMIENGLMEEVRRLLNMGYGPELKPMQSLGYKQMVQFLSKRIGWSEAVMLMKRETRHYAKRQWTWFKADSEVQWRHPSIDRNRLFREIKSFLLGED